METQEEMLKKELSQAKMIIEYLKLDSYSFELAGSKYIIEKV
jgi:hypothetical protein